VLVRFADAFNDIRNSKLLSEQSIRTMLTRPPGALGLDHDRPNLSWLRLGCPSGRPTATHAAVRLRRWLRITYKVRRRKGGICPRSAPLRTLRARALNRAWARRGVGEGVRFRPRPDAGEPPVQFDEWDVEAESRLNHQGTARRAQIIVTDPNALTRAIHDRMPLVLDKADIESWLNGTGGAELLRPAIVDRLRMWPVSRRVNRTGRGDDDPTLTDEVAP